MGVDLGEDGDARVDLSPGRRATLLGGWIFCAVGVLLTAVMVVAALLGGGANITAGALGIGFGVLGYFLGPRWLATLTVFLCAAAIIFGLAASQGLVPGIAPSDRALPRMSAGQHATGWAAPQPVSQSLRTRKLKC